MNTNRKTMIALAVTTAFTLSAPVYADINQAIDLVDGLASHRITFAEGRSMWATLDAQTQKEARQYDYSQETRYTNDYQEGAHTEYSRGPATAQTVGQSMVVTLQPQRPATGILDQSTHLDSNYQAESDAARIKAQMQEVNRLVGIEKTIDNQNRTADQHPTQSVLSHASATATPFIDRSSHLDAGNNDTARREAQLSAAIDHANSVKDGINGLNGKDGAQGIQGVAGLNGKDGKDGINGLNGKDGKDGITTTKIETDTATQDQVRTNTAALAKQDRTNDVQTGQIQITNMRIDEDRVNISANAAKLQGDEMAQANRERTANQHVAVVIGHDGVDGKEGVRGKDGVTTVVTKVETDTNTQKKVAANETAIRGVRSEQAVQGEFIQREAVAINHNAAAISSNTQRIDNNSQRIDRNAKRIDDTREDLKKGLNNAAAMTGLHYHSNDAYALSVGTANGEGAALAGGLSHGFTEHTAATVQASTSMDGGYMASVGFSGDF